MPHLSQKQRVPGVIFQYYRPVTTAINDANHMLKDALTVEVDDVTGFVLNSIIFIQDEQMKITGINYDTDILTVESHVTSYNTNTATQSGTTVTGSSTAWVVEMVGGTFTFADANNAAGGGTISAVNVGAQTMTVSTSQTVSADSYTVSYTARKPQNGTAAAQHNNNVAVEVGWITAVTHQGNSAVLNCTITKRLDVPAVAEVILSNAPRDSSSTDLTKSTGALADPTGERASRLTEFQDVRIIETETGMVLLRGRIYHVRSQYDMGLGNTVKVVVKDMLQELDDMPLSDEDPALREINVSLSTLNSRGEIAAHVINTLSSNFIMTDITKFEQSIADFTDEEKKTTTKLENGQYLWNVSSSANNALELVNLLAKTEPHIDVDTAQESEHFGYDYYVDADTTSSLLKEYPNSGKVAMHWYRRGKRPYSTNTPPAPQPATEVAKHGFTLEFPSKGWTGETGSRKAMLQDAEFTNANAAFFTSIIAHFPFVGDDEDAVANAVAHGKSTFELVKGTITGDIPWLRHDDSARRIQYIDDGEPIAGGGRIYTATNASATPPQYIGQSTNDLNPYLLFEAGQTVPCATVIYQSEANGGADSYLILSNVYDVDTTFTDVRGNDVSFRAFPKPTGTSSIRLHITPTNHSTSSSIYFDIYNGARATDRFTIKKPQIIEISENGLTNPNSIRKNIAEVLDRGGSSTTTIGKVRTHRYPCVKAIAPAVNVARSNNVLTFSTQSSVNAFAFGTSGFTNNPIEFGAKKGMVVAQLISTNRDNSKIVRYAYISAITSTTVTYGTLANGKDTSDGVELDAAYSMAIIVPVEAGSKIHLKNNLHAVDYDILVSKINFEYGRGTLTATVEGTGTNGTGHNNAGSAAIPSTKTTSLNRSLSAGGSSVTRSNQIPEYIPPSSQKVMVANGTIKAYNHNYCQIVTNPSTYITLTTQTDGKVYRCDKADGATVNNYDYPLLEIGATGGDFGSGDTENEIHVLFFRTRGVAYTSRKLQACAVKRTSGTGGKIYSEIATPNDIIVGTAKKVAVGGMCIVEVGETGAFGSGWPYDVDSIGTNRLTSTLLGKGAQLWSTNLRFEGTDYNVVRWGGTAVGAAASNSNATMSFGDDDTEAITRNTGTTFAAGLSYIYKTVGASASGTLVVTTTYSDVTRANTDRVLMATVIVVADIGQESPTIFPIGANSATLSTGVFAARSIVANDIKANTITANEVAFTPGGIATFRQDGTPTATSVGDLWYDSNDGNKLYRATATGTGNWVEATLAKIEAGTLGGLAVSATTFYMGTGHFGLANTPFFVRGVDGTDGASHAGTAGDFSLGSKFKWDDSTSTLTLEGNIEGASSIVLGEGSGTLGKLLFYDQSNNPAYQFRSLTYYAYTNVYSRIWYILNTYANSTAINGWKHYYAAIAPGVADNYLGVPAGLTTPAHGNGWAALILQRGDWSSTFSTGTNAKLGTVALTVPTPTEHNSRFPGDQSVTGGTTWDSQVKITLPVKGDFDFNAGNANDVLTTNGSGTLSWAAASGSGTVTEVTVGSGLDVSNGTSTPSITLDLSELTDMTGTVNGAQDELILLDNGAERRKLVSEITLSDFNNDSGWTSNTGDITAVLAGTGMSGGASSGVATLTNAGVTSIVAGTNVTISGATGAVTVNSAAGTVSGSGVANKFAYWTDASTLDDAFNSSSPAYLYSTGAWVSGSSIYLDGLGSGTGTDIIASGGSNLLKLDSSSERYKENIENLTLDSARIYNLVPRNFKWKDTQEPVIIDGQITDTMQTVTGANDFGLIAEEVHAILPELVTYNVSEQPDGVRYKYLSVLLLAELKKLAARVTVLEGG